MVIECMTQNYVIVSAFRRAFRNTGAAAADAEASYREALAEGGSRRAGLRRGGCHGLVHSTNRPNKNFEAFARMTRRRPAVPLAGIVVVTGAELAGIPLPGSHHSSPR